MNFLRRWILGKDLAARLEQKAYQTGIKYLIDNGKIVAPTDNKEQYIKEGYAGNDIVFAAINMVLDKVRLPEWGLYKVVDESSLKSYKSLLSNKFLTNKDYKKAMQFKYDALEPLTNFNLQQGKLLELLKYPNEDQTFQDLTADGCGYKMLTGDKFEYWNILKDGANKGIPNTIDLLPSQFTIIKANDSFPMRAVGYELLVWNQKFTKEQVLHEKYWNPIVSTSGEHMYGMSALKAAYRNLRRNNAAKDASYAKFDNGGAEEVWYFDDPRYDAVQGLEQVNALKMRLAEEYSGPSNQGKRVISGLKVGIERSGMSPVELGIIESEKWDALMFCNIWGIPPALFGIVQNTFNNLKEGEKALTTRSAIPLLTSRMNSFNRKLQTDGGFKGVNIYAAYDTECFGELQTDMKEVMDAMSMLTMVTPNEEREACNMELRPEPEADMVWIKQGAGRVPLVDYQANVVDEALMREQMIANAGNETDNGKAGSNGSANGKTGKERVSYTERLLS